jgi:hypothetical protein
VKRPQCAPLQESERKLYGSEAIRISIVHSSKEFSVGSEDVDSAIAIVEVRRRCGHALQVGRMGLVTEAIEKVVERCVQRLIDGAARGDGHHCVFREGHGADDGQQSARKGNGQPGANG